MGLMEVSFRLLSFCGREAVFCGGRAERRRPGRARRSNRARWPSARVLNQLYRLGLTGRVWQAREEGRLRRCRGSLGWP